VDPSLSKECCKMKTLSSCQEVKTSVNQT
jgi:hypothetical protein